jgi:two-component system sensor histidine kinase ChvG
VIGLTPKRSPVPASGDRGPKSPGDAPEVQRALFGGIGTAVRDHRDGTAGQTLSVAVPVQRYKEVLGAVMVTTSSKEIDQAVLAVRFEILKAFLAALGVTVLLSFYLASTIAQPVRRLALAALRLRPGLGRRVPIPDLSFRGDEIGDLSIALRDMTSALWQRMDAIERFAADVAHEIKNPLTSLQIAIDMAVRVEDPAMQRKLLAVVHEDIQRLDRLITDISDASRLDAELSRVEVEPVPIGRMLEALGEMHQTTAEGRTPAIELSLTGDPGTGQTDLPVLGIEGRLVQVFRNLIGNALSFSPPGGVIRIAALRQGDDVVVTIDDDGPGIPEGKLEAIFDRFYTERPASEKFGTHSGLGLSISKQIVEAHGGIIRAENRRDSAKRVVGARFIVRLPMK